MLAEILELVGLCCGISGSMSDSDRDAWSETHWDAKDWADWYGVDEEDLEDAIDSDSMLE